MEIMAGAQDLVVLAMSDSKKIVILGGGFAGLSAATALAQKGFAVTVVEGRQILGGRAFSFTDPETGDSIDNGQHLFMGCYHQTVSIPIAYWHAEQAGLSKKFEHSLCRSARASGKTALSAARGPVAFV